MAAHNVTNMVDLAKIGVDETWLMSDDYTQTADFTDTTVVGDGFLQIGTELNPFTGSYNGNGKTIINLYINRPLDGDAGIGIGLFGYTSSTATLSNIQLVNASIIGRYKVGGLVGVNGGAISSCSITGSVESTNWFCGGLIGENISTGVVEKSFTNCTVEAVQNYAGGLVGSNNAGSVSDSYALGAVTRTGEGGYLGGFVGRNLASGTISKCYSIGLITGSADYSGFCQDNAGTISGCFWNTQTSGQVHSDGGTGADTVTMQSIATYGSANWDFETPDTWDIDEDNNSGYPYLSWQGFGGVSGSVGFSGLLNCKLISGGLLK